MSITGSIRWLESQQVVYLGIILAITLAAVVRTLARHDDKMPYLNPPHRFEFLGRDRRRDFASNANQMLTRARALFPRQVFKMMTDMGEVVILPGHLANDIRNEPGLDFMQIVKEDFHSHIPGFDPFKTGGNQERLSQTIVKKHLTKMLNQVTQPLSAEANYAIDLHFGRSTEWREYVLMQEILSVIARLSSRVFLGPEICRNEEWLSITKNYTIDCFMAADHLRTFPSWARNYVHWFLPGCRTLRKQVATTRAIIEPIIAKRREEGTQRNGTAEPYSDAIEWMETECAGLPYDAAAAQLALSLAAIHTTTDLLCETMVQIAQHPDLFGELRAEIARVLRAEGWKKTSLYNMKLLDSVVKESQRLRPVGNVFMSRVAIEPVRLPDGSVIRKGQRCGVEISQMTDPANYERPGEFDGHRFEGMRGQPGLDSKAHLVSTGPAHLGFGHGQHACPGRFFAANEIKVALCHLLMKYDWKLAPGCKPTRIESGFFWSFDASTTVLIRKREDPEVDIDAI